MAEGFICFLINQTHVVFIWPRIRPLTLLFYYSLSVLGNAERLLFFYNNSKVK